MFRFDLPVVVVVVVVFSGSCLLIMQQKEYFLFIIIAVTNTARSCLHHIPATGDNEVVSALNKYSIRGISYLTFHFLAWYKYTPQSQ